MFETMHVYQGISAVVILVLALSARLLRLLTNGGAVAALCVGLAALLLGGNPAIAILFIFFCSSNLLGLMHRERKQNLGFEKGGTRDEWQVLANGGPAVLGLIVGETLAALHLSIHSGLIFFAAGLAEANADTWATEIGSVLGNNPRSIMTGRPVERGQSGGITLTGTVAGVTGAALIGFTYQLLSSDRSLRSAFVVFLCGFCGSMIDSILGATVQAQFEDGSGRLIEAETPGARQLRGWRWFKNDAVNFFAGMAAIALAALIQAGK